LGLLLVLEAFGCYLAWSSPAGLAGEGPRPEEAGRLASANAALARKLEGLAPRGAYLVIDTAHNRVYLRKGEKVLKEMLASCGSGSVLDDPAGGRSWTFETPRGAFRVRSKVKNPLWIKPDWAYIEEGEPIPKNPKLRAQAGMLGEYALGIGDGYFIHGTLYKRMLGRNVSHGCIRLGDEDLKELVKSVPEGTRVFIF
jgi:L,D-transpeptidase YbiS